MERSLWQCMVRSETLPFENYTVATPGQISWVFLNQLVDYDEKRGRVHIRCLAKFDQTLCEVCYKPLGDVDALPPEIQEKVYRPREHGMIPDVELELDEEPRVQDTGWTKIETNDGEVIS